MGLHCFGLFGRIVVVCSVDNFIAWGFGGVFFGFLFVCFCFGFGFFCFMKSRDLFK